MTVLKITQIAQSNNIVIKQEGGHFFIAAPNTFIIDKSGFLTLIIELMKIGFITPEHLNEIMSGVAGGEL